MNPGLLWVWSAGLLGEHLTHPGAFVAVERPIAERGVVELVGGGRLGGYHHFGNHTGVYAQAELGVRLGGERGLYVEAFGGLGGQQSFVAGPLYVRGAEGEVRRTLDLGRPTLRGAAALGVGWETGSPGIRRVFGRAEGWLRGPHNQRVWPGFGVSLGIAWGGA